MRKISGPKKDVAARCEQAFRFQPQALRLKRDLAHMLVNLARHVVALPL
jgi:hypothetical protein